MSNFKIGIIAIFSVSFVVGIAVFAMYKGSGEDSSSVLVWGTISNEAFDSAYKSSSLVKNKNITVTYIKKNVSDFDSDFIEALADGVGPDVVILREDVVYKHRNKILTIPYKSYSARDFKDRFVEGSEIFLTQEGIMALPFIIDPMVMYWNRDIFSSNLIAQTPVYWDEMYDLSRKITKKDNSGNIMKSSLAFGEWKNITNAKEIISMLLLQAGTPITSNNNGVYSSDLDKQFDYVVAPGLSVLNFYTQFSNPTGSSYSWNRSLPTSQNFFLSGDLAIYFGLASEIFSIQQKSPNLNFDVTNVPQIREVEKKANFGHIYGLAIVKQSKSIPSAFSLIASLTEAGPIKAVENATYLPPVRRDLLAGKQTDPYKDIFYSSALISKSWVDPDNTATASIFREMVESVTSGRSRTSESLSNASQSLNILFNK